LLGKGFQIAIFDSFVKLSRLLGKNKEFIDAEIPHLENLLHEDAETVLAGAEVIVVGHADAATRALIAQRAAGKRIVDLNGYADLRGLVGVDYEGICW
jgi:GDP-mannose 6-dehydrogenase